MQDEIPVRTRTSIAYFITGGIPLLNRNNTVRTFELVQKKKKSAHEHTFFDFLFILRARRLLRYV